jgi:hypothetical protein
MTMETIIAAHMILVHIEIAILWAAVHILYKSSRYCTS